MGRPMMPRMLALSIKQPLAWLVVHGYKGVENRSWRTKFRGRLLVHASKTFDMDWYLLARDELLSDEDRQDLPRPEEFERGGIVGSVEIVDCVKDIPHPWAKKDNYQFVLKNPRPCKFYPEKGKLGLFEVKWRGSGDA